MQSKCFTSFAHIYEIGAKLSISPNFENFKSTLMFLFLTFVFLLNRHKYLWNVYMRTNVCIFSTLYNKRYIILMQPLVSASIF